MINNYQEVKLVADRKYYNCFVLFYIDQNECFYNFLIILSFKKNTFIFHFFCLLQYIYNFHFCCLQLVAGSVVMAFLTVCPDRIDLIHKNYRKLCNLLVDVDEWGQVMIINLLTRYARSQFLDPNKEVGVVTCSCYGNKKPLK